MASKSKKKKRRSLLILSGCIILFAGGYAALAVRDAKKQKAEEEAQKEEEITLLSMEEDELTGIEFENSYGSMKLVQKGGRWIYEKDKKFPLNQDNAENMAGEVSDLQAVREIVKEPEDLGEYGLSEPAIKVVCTAENEEHTLYIGDESPSDEDGYYCYLEGKNTVYEIDSDVFTAFHYSMQQMMELEDAPEITASQVTKLSVKNPEEFDFTAVNKAMGDSSGWTIKEPYDMSVVGDESNLTTFFGNYESISYEGAVEYNCMDFSQYGLEEQNPGTAEIEIAYYELVESEDTGEEDSEDTDSEEAVQKRVEHQAKIVIGNQNEDGEYYVRVNDSSYVYLMSEESVDNLIPDSAYTYVEPTISRISVDNMTKIVFTAEDKEYKVTSKEKITTNEDGEEETETDYFFNNKTMDISAFNAITTTWSTLKTSKEMTEKQRSQVDETKVMLTAELASRKNRQTVSFFSFDKSYYAVRDGDTLLFLADKRDVDAFIEKLKQQEEA